MEESWRHFRPLARSEDLLVETLPEEILVYDLQRDQGLCLDPFAACVWPLCDGQKSVMEIAQLVQDRLQRPVEEIEVWEALAQLERAHLLDEDVPQEPTVAADMATGSLTRRELMRHAGAMAAAAMITSVVAPTVAECATLEKTGSPSNSSAMCESGLASGGVCVDGGPESSLR